MDVETQLRGLRSKKYSGCRRLPWHTKQQKGAGAGENVVCFHPNPGAFVCTFLYHPAARRRRAADIFLNWQGGIYPARFALVCPAYSSPDSTNENELPESVSTITWSKTLILKTAVKLPEML